MRNKFYHRMLKRQLNKRVMRVIARAKHMHRLSNRSMLKVLANVVRKLEMIAVLQAGGRV